MLSAAALTALLLLGQQTSPNPKVTSEIRGVVTDASTSAPLTDVRVSIGIGRSTKTDAEGRFAFRDLDAGRYALTVSTVGYIFVRRRVDVGVNTIVEVTVPLAEGTGTYQETVNVTSDVRPPPELGVASQSELGSAGLQDLRGVAADDPMRAMQALPGAATGNDFQAQFSMRGSAFRHVGIVTEGVSTPLLLHQVRGAGDTGSIAMINTDVLRHASLLAGPHPLRHGDWIGATMEFEIREGSRDRAGVRAAVSGTSASTVIEGPIGSSKRGSWLVSLRRSYIDWLIRKIEPTTDSTFGFTDLQGKAVYDLTGRHQLQFVVMAGRARYEEVAASTTNGLKDATSRASMASVAWRYTRPSLIVTQRVSVLASEFTNKGQLGQLLGNGHSPSIVWRGDVIKPLKTFWTLEGGARTDSNRTTQMLRQYRLVNNALQVLTQQSFSAPNTIASGWAQIARRTPSTGFAAGLRAAHASLGSSSAVSPWVLGERTMGAFTLRAGASAATQFPDVVFFMANARQLTESMAPERAVSVDAGLEHRLTKTMRWLVTGFRREDSNVIRLAGENRIENGVRVFETPQPVFGGELDGTSRGVDLRIERRAPNGPSGWIGYMWARTRYHDTITGEDFDGDFDQRHTLNAFVQQRLSYRWAVSAKLRAGSNFPIVGYFDGTPSALMLGAERNRVRLPVYTRLDLRADRTFTFNQRRLTLFIEVMNATGRRNLRQSDGVIFSNLSTDGFVERLIPRVPSAGFLIEF